MCTSSYKIFCHKCCFAKSQNLISLPKFSTSPFTQEGFNNWKKALDQFSSHEKSEMHREAEMKLAARHQGVDISSQLSKQLEADKRLNREMLIKVLEYVQFLVKQGLPLRGHNEHADALQGNLYQLLLLVAKSCQGMSAWLAKRDYISPSIINE